MFQQPEETPRAISVSKRSRVTRRSRSTTGVTQKNGRSNAPFAIEDSRQRYGRTQIYIVYNNCYYRF